MPDASGNFKGIAVNGAAWDRIFGRNPNGCIECSGACGECLSIDASDLTADQLADKLFGGTDPD